MKLEEIIDMYGPFADYLDMRAGIIYAISKPLQYEGDDDHVLIAAYDSITGEFQGVATIDIKVYEDAYAKYDKRTA